MPYFKPSRCAPSFGFPAFALAGALLCAPGALAADLDPGYADVPPPIPQQSVSFGSGWYVRGDIGVTDDKYEINVGKTPRTAIDPTISRSTDVGYDLTLGGGYSFTNSFRADVIFDFLQPISASGHVQKVSPTYNYGYYGNLNQYVGLVNGYYDIGPWSIFTPYVGVGVGVGFQHVNAATFGLNDSTNVNNTSFAWALMAGVAIDVYNHTKVDIGYRYLNTGNILSTRTYANEIRIGVRYMIDN